MNFITILIVLLLNFIAISFWLRILSKISHTSNLSIKIAIYLSISSTVILLWYDIINKSWYLWWFSDIRYVFFRLFIIIWLSLSYLLINKKNNLWFFSRLVLSSGLWFLSFVLWGRLWQAAWSEEITKFFSASSIYDKMKKVSSDILIYSVLAAVWFGFIENIIYLIRGILLTGDVLTVWVSRFLMIYIVHIFFTGIVWYGSYLDEIKWNGLYVISTIAMIVGATIHGIYNYSLWKTNLLMVFPLLWLWYFFTIYIFYKSDKLFVGSI